MSDILKWFFFSCTCVNQFLSVAVKDVCNSRIISVSEVYGFPIWCPMCAKQDFSRAMCVDYLFLVGFQVQYDD